MDTLTDNTTTPTTNLIITQNKSRSGIWILVVFLLLLLVGYLVYTYTKK